MNEVAFLQAGIDLRYFDLGFWWSQLAGAIRMRVPRLCGRAVSEWHYVTRMASQNLTEHLHSSDDRLRAPRR